MIARTEDPTPAELATRVAQAYEARQALATMRPSFQAAGMFVWFAACCAAIGEMSGPLLVKMLLFCAVAQVPVLLIEMGNQRRKLDAVIALVRQADLDR